MADTQKAKDSQPFINATQRKIVDRYLQSQDALYTEVVFTAGKVVLHAFKDEWVETNTEGPLYLYRRRDKEHPQRLLVMNRNGAEDFRLEIPREYELEYQEQFVIFSGKDKANIFGFWFDNEAAAKTLFKLLDSKASE